MLLFLICLLAGPGSAAVYQLPDVSQDTGVKTFHVCNQYADKWEGIVLPFIGGFGDKANNSGMYTEMQYYTVYEDSEFVASATDVIGSVSVKFKLPYGYDYENAYVMPISFKTENDTSQFYIRVTVPGTTYMNHYLIEVLDENQTSIVNTTVAKLGSSSPAYVTFEDNKVKITHVNTLTGLGIIIWESSEGSASVDIPYTYCKDMYCDISGYGFPVDINMKVLDGFETTKTYESIPMIIYWLVVQVVPDNNQNLYYFFKAVDSIWSVSLGIILLCFSMPFMWLFFAGICGLCTVVIRGSLTSGIPAGIKTFISVSMIPVKLIGFILEMIARLITAIKPI